MSNLWIYWRRPSLAIRYRHGGETAVYPALQQPIVGMRKTAEAAIVASSGLPKAPNHRENNILDFPLAQQRAERGRLGRSARPKNKPSRRE
jgi:hypothetical protein